jgi:hypothetical protein
MDNIVSVKLDSRYASTLGVWQYDYGQVLRITGPELPPAVEVQFSLDEKSGETLSRVGTTVDGVTEVKIPDELLTHSATSNYRIYAYIYLTDETSGNTKYEITIPVRVRSKPTSPAEDPETDPDLFRETVVAVNASAERAENAASSAMKSAEEAKKYAEGKQEDIEKAVSDYMKENPVSASGKLSDLQEDATHRTVTDTEKKSWNRKSNFSGSYNDLDDKPTIPTVPTTLPNPQALTITYGNKTHTYDGSEALAITIETGGIERVEKLATDTTVTLEPNKLYIFPEMASLTYTIGEGTGEVHFIFKSGATATRVVHPTNVNIGSFSVNANKVYEVSILEGLLTSQNWSVS